ncbi:MAG: hypothetical protein EBX52_14275 [Proteobacteria bacterium]|nr:hypothetical protein [Pseudomonadota bacterium]
MRTNPSSGTRIEADDSTTRQKKIPGSQPIRRQDFFNSFDLNSARLGAEVLLLAGYKNGLTDPRQSKKKSSNE